MPTPTVPILLKSDARYLWVLKSKIFGQESTQRKFKKKAFDQLRFVNKCQNRTFKVNYQCQKSTEFFQKKKFHLLILKTEYQFRRQFFSKNFFFLTQFLNHFTF